VSLRSQLRRGGEGLGLNNPEALLPSARKNTFILILDKHFTAQSFGEAKAYPFAANGGGWEGLGKKGYAFASLGKIECSSMRMYALPPD
jgi:hypothetical protein